MKVAVRRVPNCRWCKDSGFIQMIFSSAPCAECRLGLQHMEPEERAKYEGKWARPGIKVEKLDLGTDINGDHVGLGGLVDEVFAFGG